MVTTKRCVSPLCRFGDRRRRQARISWKSAAIAVSRAAIAAMRLVVQRSPFQEYRT